MILEIGNIGLLNLLCRQLESNFLLGMGEREVIASAMDDALAACEENFLYAPNKYCTMISEGRKQAVFNPFHSVQYMIFLYYLSRRIYERNGGGKICDKLYYLNKMLNGVDLFYAISLPRHFYAEHPLGSVMGRAIYSDGLIFYQGCTVGGTVDREGQITYPIIGENVWLYANSSILGNCLIGNNVRVGAGAIIKNQNIPDDSLVFGESPNLIIKSRR